MSPLWRERLELHVGAAELSAARYRGPGRRGLLAQGAVPLVGEGTGEGVAAVGDALASLLRSLPGDAADAWVTLSLAHLRLALVPGAAALRGRDEHRAAAAHTLVSVYGEAARHWTVACCRAGDDSLIAAGIDTALQDAITTALGVANARLSRLQPLFALAFNQCLPALRGPAWFVTAEPGRALVCFVRQGALQALRCHRSHGALAAELPRWLDQGRLLDGVNADGAKLVLAGRGLQGRTLPGLAWPLSLIDMNHGEALPAW